MTLHEGVDKLLVGFIEEWVGNPVDLYETFKEAAEKARTKMVDDLRGRIIELACAKGVS